MSSSPGKAALWTGRIMTLLAGLPFLLSGIMKLSRGPEVLQGMEHLGWPVSLLTTLAVLELAGVALYYLPPFAFLGAVILTGYLGGAIGAHVRLGEPVITHIVIGLLIWGGLFLREPRLRGLLPVWGRSSLIEREIEIDRPVETVFTYIRQLKNFQAWNPFLKADPSASVSTSGTDAQPGCILEWKGQRAGEGEQQITRIIEGELVEFDLRFKKPFAATNTGYFKTERLASGKTKVRWGMLAQPVFPMTVIGLVLPMGKMIGGSFESGLRDLKAILEK